MKDKTITRHQYEQLASTRDTTLTPPTLCNNDIWIADVDVDEDTLSVYECGMHHTTISLAIAKELAAEDFEMPF